MPTLLFCIIQIHVWAKLRVVYSRGSTAKPAPAEFLDKKARGASVKFTGVAFRVPTMYL